MDELDDDMDELDDDMDELDDDNIDEVSNDKVHSINSLDNVDFENQNNEYDDNLDEIENELGELNNDITVTNLDNNIIVQLEQIEDVSDDESEHKIIELDDNDSMSNTIANDVKIVTNKESVDTTNSNVKESSVETPNNNSKSLVLGEITVETLKSSNYTKMTAPELREIVKKFELSENPKSIKKKDLLDLVEKFVNSQ